MRCQNEGVDKPYTWAAHFTPNLCECANCERGRAERKAKMEAKLAEWKENIERRKQHGA
ncbi:hypothetical protein [Bacillus solitudinis]|uniref:hypothetical protein n=1 Tax=Bacillus solitudinis TaxID=2014074 RepID=UPI0012FE26B4|nr:hypothetical protein [Bacillus solitudinis]